ncbi:MAG: hypothetical protein ACJAS3_003348 [Roseivirga sp.]|jgi:hypothetical protein
MKIHKARYLYIFLLLTPTLLFAQEAKVDSLPSIFKSDMLFTEVNPIHPFGIFILNAPFYIGTFNENSQKLKVSYGMANIWGPQVTMHYPQNITPQQSRDINAHVYMTDREDLFARQNIATERKTFSTDGVLQNMSFAYTWNLRQNGTFIFNLNTYLLSGGSSPLHYIASDKFIEGFHTAVGSEDDFGRKLYPFNRANIDYTDENGNNISISKGTAFLGTLDVHYYYPLYRKNNRTSYHTLQLGGHIAIPLNNYYSEVSGGMSVAFLYRKKITKTFSADIGLDGLLTNNTLLSLNSNTTNITDRDLRKNAKLYVGFNFYKPSKDRTFYFGILNNYQDPLLKGMIFNKTQNNYKDLGVSFLGPGDTWQGVTIEKSFKVNKLTPAAMYFFSLKTYLIVGHKTPNGEFNFTMGEDFTAVNNAPDIQYGFSYAFNLN